MARLEAAAQGLPPSYDVPRLMRRLGALIPHVTGVPDAVYDAFLLQHRPDATTAVADLA